jgi:hypothetical protein
VIGSSRPQPRAEYLGARAKQVGSTFPLVRFTCLSGVRRMQLWRIRLFVCGRLYIRAWNVERCRGSYACSLRRHIRQPLNPALIPFACDWRFEITLRTAALLHGSPRNNLDSTN